MEEHEDSWKIEHFQIDKVWLAFTFIPILQF